MPELHDEAGVTVLSGRRSTRVMALLIFLRLQERGRSVARISLPRRLWTETGSDAGVVTRNAASDLREVIGAAFDAADEMRVDPDGVACDYDELSHAIDEFATLSCAESESRERSSVLINRVATLYRGDFLEGWTRAALRPSSTPGRPGYAEPFIEWVEARRGVARAQVQESLSAAMHRAAGQERWASVSHIAETLRARFRDPYRDDLRLRSVELRAATALGDRMRAETIYQEILRAQLTQPLPDDVLRDIELARDGRVHRRPPQALARGKIVQTSGPEEVATAPDRSPDRSERRRAARPRLVALAGALILATLVARSYASRRSPATDLSSAASNASNQCTSSLTRATLVRHNYQLGVVLKPGQRFTKGWWVLNQGGCTLGRGLTLHYLRDSGASLSGARTDPTRRDIAVNGGAGPGQELLLEVPMRAPPSEGEAAERWTLLDASRRPIAINGSPDALFARVRVVPHAPPCARGTESAFLVSSSHIPHQTLLVGRSFLGTWSIRNDGDCTWPSGLRLQRVSSSSLSGRDSAVATDRPVEVGGIYTFRVPMQAPERAGHYTESWSLFDGDRPVRVGGEESLAMRVAAVGSEEASGQTEVPVCGKGESRAGWIGEVPEDSVVFEPGATFRKTWTLSNTGPCQWERLYLRFRDASSIRMSSTDEVGLSAAVYPRASHSFDVLMRAPSKPGVYTETWYVRDGAGDPVYATRTDTVWATVIVRGRRPSRP